MGCVTSRGRCGGARRGGRRARCACTRASAPRTRRPGAWPRPRACPRRPRPTSPSRFLRAHTTLLPLNPPDPTNTTKSNEESTGMSNKAKQHAMTVLTPQTDTLKENSQNPIQMTADSDSNKVAKHLFYYLFDRWGSYRFKPDVLNECKEKILLKLSNHFVSI